MRRTSLNAVQGGRAAVYAAVGLQGAMVVTFFVAVQLLLDRDYFSLSAAQYGAVYVPVFAAAVLAVLFAVRGSRSAARGSVFRLGLVLSAVSRAAMIPTVAVAVRHGAVFFPDLMVIGALTGAGFALVCSAATAFELDIDPARPERHLLRLTLTLAAGMAVGPLLQIGFLEAGLWWACPLIARRSSTSPRKGRRSADKARAGRRPNAGRDTVVVGGAAGPLAPPPCAGLGFLLPCGAGNGLVPRGVTRCATAVSAVWGSSQGRGCVAVWRTGRLTPVVPRS